MNLISRQTDEINNLASVANDHGFYTLPILLAIELSQQPERRQLVHSWS